MTSLFDPLVDYYDAARPDYPDAHFDALAALTRPLEGRGWSRSGAGTGIATRALRRRGALVLPVDHGAAMLRRLQERGAAFPTAVQGDAHALPVRSGWADLVCYAQAWHWTDPFRATRRSRTRAPARRGAGGVVEPRSVRRSGLAGAPARRASERPIRRWDGDDQPPPRVGRPSSNHSAGPCRRRPPRGYAHLPLEDYLVWMRSKSYVGAIAEPMATALEQFMADERASLLEAFPDGQIVEPFVTELYVVRPPAPRRSRERLNACASRSSEPARSARRCCPGCCGAGQAPADLCFAEQYAARGRRSSASATASTARSSVDAAKTADVVVLAVKPPGCRAAGVRDRRRRCDPQTLVVSVAAGISTAFIERAPADRQPGRAGHAEHAHAGGRRHVGGRGRVARDSRRSGPRRGAARLRRQGGAPSRVAARRRDGAVGQRPGVRLPARRSDDRRRRADRPDPSGRHRARRSRPSSARR